PVTNANLRRLYLMLAHRRLGMAYLLVGVFLTWARARGCVEAHVDHYTLNEPAQLLYERHGFAARSTSRALDLTTP
ncbi:MAG: GNAT family N-acetyltransferase, partial [Ilumatobacteraceae bacterium]|nr:GNAT family N-acetyltransferase [Ilumatobacteraceae bacterium]